MAAKAKKANELDRLKSKVTGQETKSGYGSRRNDRAEFSDNDLISDDDQDEIPQDVETRPGKESSVPNTRTLHGRGALRNAGPTSSQDVLDKRKRDEIYEITAPKKKPPEKIPPKSFIEQIFTRVFLAQVFICVACNLIVSCVFVFLLMGNLNVSDTRDYSNRFYNGYDIDIESKVRKAIDTELDKAYKMVRKVIDDKLDMSMPRVELKIEEHINDKLNRVDIDGRVKASVERHVPKVARSEAQSAFKEPEIKDLIEIEITEKTMSMENEFKEAFNRRVETLEGTVRGIEESITPFKERVEMKIEEHINDKLNRVDIDGRVKASVERHVPNVARRESISAFKEPEIKDLIEIEITEKTMSMENEFKEAFNRRVETLEAIVRGIEKNEESITPFKEKLRKSETDILKMFDNYKTTSSTVDKLSESRVALSNYIEKYLNEISDLQTTIAEADARLKEVNAEKENLMHALSEAKALKEEHIIKLDQLDRIISSVKANENFKQKLETIQHNVFNKGRFIIAFMILIVIVLVLTVSVYNLYQRQKNFMHWPTALPYMSNHGDHQILKQIQEKPLLRSGVCLISFDEKRTTTHQRLLDSAMIPNCEVKVHVIRSHEHIPQLPRCKVYLMCTEFSERHVIIEELGQEHGDLHRATYNAVMKMGGCLIILYTRDPGSRNLKDQSLYNNKIYCVKNQPELSVLEQDGRFFSVYDDLTPFQTGELKKKITENITVDA